MRERLEHEHLISGSIIAANGYIHHKAVMRSRCPTSIRRTEANPTSSSPVSFLPVLPRSFGCPSARMGSMPRRLP